MCCTVLQRLAPCCVASVVLCCNDSRPAVLHRVVLCCNDSRPAVLHRVILCCNPAVLHHVLHHVVADFDVMNVAISTVHQPSVRGTALTAYSGGMDEPMQPEPMCKQSRAPSSPASFGGAL